MAAARAAPSRHGAQQHMCCCVLLAEVVQEPCFGCPALFWGSQGFLVGQNLEARGF